MTAINLIKIMNMPNIKIELFEDPFQRLVKMMKSLSNRTVNQLQSSIYYEVYAFQTHRISQIERCWREREKQYHRQNHISIPSFISLNLLLWKLSENCQQPNAMSLEIETRNASQPQQIIHIFYEYLKLHALTIEFSIANHVADVNRCLHLFTVKTKSRYINNRTILFYG